MGCRCAERREALMRGAGALRRGDTQAAAEAGRFVANTMTADAARVLVVAKTATAQRMSAARTRLAGR